MNKKGLTSFFMTLGFIQLLVSGVILYIVPPGRVAQWVDWTLFGLTKTQWGNIHTLSGFMLLIAGGFHLYFNWRPLKHYLYSRVKKRVNLKKELAISLAITVIMVFSSITELPPFSYVFDFGAHVKDSWVVEEKYEAPFGHAELLSFDSFTNKLKINKEKALAELKANGIQVVNGKDSLAKIAKSNQISPMGVYLHIRKFEPAKEEVASEMLTAEKVEDLLSGTGLGRRNLNWLLAKFKIDPEKAAKRLKKSNIQATNDETFHDIAGRSECGPLDIAKVVLVKGHALNPL
jgi:hypothetical protein